MSQLNNNHLTTRDVTGSLKRYAYDNFIPFAECDFTLEKIDTFYNDLSSEEFIPLEGTFPQEAILKRHINFEQLYTITIKKQQSKMKLNYSLEFNKYKTEAYLLLDPSSDIPYKKILKEQLLESIVDEINKIKIKNKILIHLFDTQMQHDIEHFIEDLYNDKFHKKTKLTLFQGINPKIEKEDEFIFFFQHEIEEHQNVFIQKETPLAEYKKRLFTNPGFNIYGNIIDNSYFCDTSGIDKIVDLKSIEILEGKYKKIYKSKQEGYLVFNSDTFEITSQTPQHDTSLYDNDDLEALLPHHNIILDVVEESQELTFDHIHVNSDVHEDSILEAHNMIIEGSTHEDSMQFSKYANINRHSGTLRCHEANIALLDEGIVHATTVVIESSLGGEVHAKDITIGHVKDNLRVYASNSITIKSVSGCNNLFKINYLEVPILKSKIELINDDIQDLEYALEEAKKHNPSKIPLIEAKIKDFKNEQKEIQESNKNSRIEIQSPLQCANKIVFTLSDDSTIEYETKAQQYEPFYLNFSDGTITLQPVNKTFIQ